MPQKCVVYGKYQSYADRVFLRIFKEACRISGVSEEVHDALTGHSGGSVGRNYGGVPLDVKADAITALSYAGLDLTDLYAAF